MLNTRSCYKVFKNTIKIFSIFKNLPPSDDVIKKSKIRIKWPKKHKSSQIIPFSSVDFHEESEYIAYFSVKAGLKEFEMFDDVVLSDVIIF